MTMDERLENLVRKHARRAYGLAHGLTGQASDADDLVQRAVLVAARKRESIPVDGVWPWFARILALEARNMRRKSRPEARSEEIMRAEDPSPADPARLARDRELAAAVGRELAALPEHEREAVVLVHVSGLTYREASAVLGLAPATLSQRVRDAIDRLRRSLGVKESSLCAALGLLESLPPQGGLDLAITRWLSVAEGATAASTASLIGGLIVSKNVVSALALAVVVLAFGVWWNFMDDRPGGLEPGAAEIAEQAPPYSAPRRVDGNAVETVDTAPSLTETAMRRIGAVSGRVTDRAGEPREGAALRLIRRDERSSILARARTDAEGRFRLVPELPQGDEARRIDFDIVVEDPEWAGSRRDGLWLEEGVELAGLDLLVYRPARIEGRLLSKRGHLPIKGALVTAGTASDPSLPPVIACARQDSAVTDGDGRFAISGLPAGTILVHIQHEGGIRGRNLLPVSGDTRVVLEEGEHRAGLEIIAAENRLRFELDREPQGAVAFEYRQGDNWWNSLGFEDKGTGPYELIGFDSIRHLRIRTAAGNSAMIEVPGTPGDDVDLGVVALESRPLAGARIVGEEGRPLARAFAQLRSADRRISTGAMSDEDGRFRIDQIRDDAWTIVVQHASHATVETSLVLPRDEFDQEIVMPRGGQIGGRVKVAGRAPSADVRGADGRAEPIKVAVLPADSRLPPEKNDVLYAARSLVPDAEGRFVIPGLGAGPHVVAAVFEDRVVFEKDVAVGRSDVELDVGVGGALRGRVLEGDRPSADIAIRLTRKPQELRPVSEDLQARSDAEGAFSFRGLSPGVWYLKAEGESLLAGATLAARRVEIVEGRSVERDLLLSGARPILEGRVLVGGESRFKLALLVRPGVAMPVARVPVDGDGRFAVDGLADGPYYLWLVDSLYNPSLAHRRALELTAAAPAELDLDLGAGRLQGSLVGADEAKISLRPILEDELGPDAAARFAVIEFQAEQSRFLHEDLPVGRYRIVVTAEGQSPWSREIEIDDSTDLQVDLAERGGQLHLRVAELRGFQPEDLGGGFFDRLLIARILDSEGKEVGVLDESRYLRLQKDSDCRIALAAGRYRLLVQGKLAETINEEIEIRAGETLERDLVARRAAEYRLKLEGKDLDAGRLAGMKLAVFRSDGSRVEEIDLALAAGAQDQVALAAGILRVMPLAAGSYRISIEIPGFEAAETKVALQASEVKEGALRLESRD